MRKSKKFWLSGAFVLLILQILEVDFKDLGLRHNLGSYCGILSALSLIWFILISKFEQKQK
jgi:hypothetical protein